jgi:hypothetical protein
MVTVQIQLDESLAEARNCSIEDLVRDFLADHGAAGASEVPPLGMFADDHALIDEIVEAAMTDRAEQPMRRPSG